MIWSVEWVFFDVGSTLVDESKANRHRLLDAIAGTDIPYEKAYRRAAELAKQNFASPLKCLGLPLTPWHSEDEIAYPQAESCLAKLHERYRLGIIANQVSGTADRMEKYGLARDLDLIISSAEEGMAKPDIKIYEIALERAGCLPEQAVMIGDRLDNDIVPAKKVGMKTIWIKQGFGGMGTPLSERERPDEIVYELRELPGLLRADAVIHRKGSKEGL